MRQVDMHCVSALNVEACEIELRLILTMWTARSVRLADSCLHLYVFLNTNIETVSFSSNYPMRPLAPCSGPSNVIEASDKIPESDRLVSRAIGQKMDPEQKWRTRPLLHPHPVVMKLNFRQVM
jgi:hypothetical protein